MGQKTMTMGQSVLECSHKETQRLKHEGSDFSSDER